MKRVVVTGGGGYMGRVIVDGLRKSGKYDVVSAAHHPDALRGEIPLDVTDLQSCIDVLAEADTVIHMAFLLANRSVDFSGVGISTNTIGTYHIYEAARINNVRRVIFGSSNHVFGFYPIEAEVGDYDEYRPDSPYGLFKCFSELIGRYYSDKYGISCMNLRIGHCAGTRTGYCRGTREYKQWLSSRDLVQLLEKCIEADDKIKFGNYFGISSNEDFWDLARARDELGYCPQDDGRDLITNETVHNETAYKGGRYPIS